MTRKDYKLIAAAILATRNYAEGSRKLDSNAVLNYLVGYLGSSLGFENPRFDYGKFATATDTPRYFPHTD